MRGPRDRDQGGHARGASVREGDLTPNSEPAKPIGLERWSTGFMIDTRGVPSINFEELCGAVIELKNLLEVSFVRGGWIRLRLAVPEGSDARLTVVELQACLAAYGVTPEDFLP